MEFIFKDDQLFCYNGNDILCNGFPIFGSFLESLLIANILDDDYPEIILKDGNVLYLGGTKNG